MRPHLQIYFLLVLAALQSEAQQTNQLTIKTKLVRADSLMAISDWQNSSALYQSILKDEPHNPKVWGNLGYCNHQLKHYSNAVEHYRKALANTTDTIVVMNTQIRLARTYAMMKQYDNAISSLHEAAELGYRKTGELEKETDYDGLRDDRRFKELVNRTRENAFPCMRQKHLREFDFWIGEWTAFVTGTEQIAGYSRIDIASGGCMILENWTSAGIVPFTGKSINFIDASTGKWKQVWIGSNAPDISEFLNGSYRDGAMRFEFEENMPEGKKQLVQFIFYNESPDQVRQHHMTSSDGGKTWNTTYDFTYRRRRE